MTAYKFLIKDIYTNEKREFEHISESTDSRLAHKEGMRFIKYEEDIEIPNFLENEREKKEKRFLQYCKDQKQ